MRRVVASVLVSVMLVAIAVVISRHVARRAATSFFAGAEGRFGALKISPQVGLWHAYPPWGHGDLQLALWRVDSCDGVCHDGGTHLFLSATGGIVGATPASLPFDLEEMRARARDVAQGDLVSLDPGRELELRLFMEGCFGSTEQRFVFSRNADGEAWAKVVSEERMGPGASRVPRERRLTRQDVLALDRELRAARRASGHSCTGHRTFDLEVRDGSRVVGEDHFVDDACTNVRLPDGLTLERL
jgi:hypothetical protein